MTAAHSPRRVWRNRRMVGYQGQSLRSINQRQSAACGSSVQVGRPSAGQMRDRRVNGDDQVQVSDEGGGLREVSQLVGEIVQHHACRRMFRVSRGGADLKADESHSLHCRQRRQGREAAGAQGVGYGPACPDQANAARCWSGSTAFRLEPQTPFLARRSSAAI